MEIRTQKDAEDLIYMSYLRAIDHIDESLDEKVKKPEFTRKLLDYIGSPDKNQKYILVTGSKGKGSTSRFISSLLSHMGFKVGLFTSPHLVNFNERIRIDGKAISTEDFIRISNIVAKGVYQIEGNVGINEYQGPVGITLAIAATYFKENQTSINVVEIGRGGLYDDTNVLLNHWAVITTIMNEHTNNLGPSITNIVDHKVGIIKESTKYVYSGQQSDIVASILATHDSMKADYTKYYNKEYNVQNVKMTSTGTCFDVSTKKGEYKNLTIPLLGEFQAVNAAVAIQICEDINGGKLDSTIVEKCFSHIQWPGRCEIVNFNPTVIIDGAINETSAYYIRNVIDTIKKTGNKTVSIIGVPKDKDYKGVINVLSEFSDMLLLTKPDVTHLSFPDDGLEFAKTFNDKSLEFPFLIDAFKYARNIVKADLILIVGTQTLIGNAKRIMGQSLLDIGK